MNHLGTCRLETPRLILRAFTPEDIPVAYRNWCADPDVTRYLRWPAHASEDVTRYVITDWISAYPKPDHYQWAMELKELGEVVGSISVVESDERTAKIHIGYCVGKAWWGKGYTTEALGALVDFFFDKVGAGRIESLHDPHNPASGRVMSKCGLQPEAVLRKADWNNQGIVDACMHAILREEWEAARAAKP